MYSFTNILFILDVAQKAFSCSVTLSLPTQVKPQNDGATEPADQLLHVPNAPLALHLHIFYGTYPPPSCYLYCHWTLLEGKGT